MTHRRIASMLLVLLGTGATALADDGEWKTAYFKRGFVGPYDAGLVGGENSTLRMRTPIPFDGTKVRVYVRGPFEYGTELTRMTLVQGVNDEGKVKGPSYTMLFKGEETLKLDKGLKEAVSDAVAVPVTKGTWYVEDRYASRKFPYAYEVDKGWFEPGDAFGKETLKKSVAARTGILYRVDVLTTDKRPTILCFGDSITHGFGSTPNADQRYPVLLGKLLDRPVLNLGQNSDTVSSAAGLPGTVKGLPGVDTIVFMMGINDIFMGTKVNSAKAYAGIVAPMIDGCKKQGKKVYIGTITPAGGVKQYDADPAKEKLRAEINEWIRKGNGADGVIDFDAAVADPANPVRIRAEYQSDWIHPSDRGYQAMAEAAAKVIKGKSQQ